VCTAQERVRRGGFAVQEFRAKLDRRVESREAPRPAAAADALARLENDDRAAAARERIGGGEAGSAGADDENVGGFRVTPPSLPRRRQPCARRRFLS
jgi:hypothetical protein